VLSIRRNVGNTKSQITMPLCSFGVFRPEEIAEMGEILDAAFEKLQEHWRACVVRERIAMRIMAAARFGERDRARLLEAALRGSD
jgi:hypothetical protein